MTKPLAERLYDAFVQESGWTDAPVLADWADKGSAWYTLANDRDGLLAPPEQREPYEHDLKTPIPVRYVPDTTTEIMEDLPKGLHIRPRVAGDLCLPECSSSSMTFSNAIQASIHGVTPQMLEDRIDPVDAELGTYLVRDATGPNAATLIQLQAIGLMPEIPAELFEIENWEAVANAMFIEDKGDRFEVACRSPGLGTVKIGPYRTRHRRIWEDGSEASNEWAGRLAALADMSGLPLSMIQGARIEDVSRMWAAFQILKKNASATAQLYFTQILSARSSDTPPSTTTGGPTPG